VAFIKIGDVFPLWLLGLLIGITFALVIWAFTRASVPPKFHFVRHHCSLHPNRNFAHLGHPVEIPCQRILSQVQRDTLVILTEYSLRTTCHPFVVSRVPISWCTHTHQVLAYMGFAVSVIWIYVVANEIVNVLQAIGALFGISQAVLGLTVLAWGNSIGGEPAFPPVCGRIVTSTVEHACPFARTPARISVRPDRLSRAHVHSVHAASPRSGGFAW